MLVQFHAQNPKDCSQTEMLMQGEVDSDEQAQAWFASCNAKWLEMKDQIPNDWQPMVCTEASEHFWMTAATLSERSQEHDRT